MPYYTIFSLISIIVVVILDSISNIHLLRQYRFWIFMFIIIVLTLIFDNYAVQKGIYDFSPQMITGIRLPYSPLENSLFSFSFITSQVMLFEWYTQRKYKS